MRMHRLDAAEALVRYLAAQRNEEGGGFPWEVPT
jgi:hypothetical protein